MDLELRKADWSTFFDNLNRRRYEWMAEVEVLSPTAGDQVLSNGLPFNGVTVENVGDRISLDISVGETTDHHQTHMIIDPVRIAYLSGDETHSEVVNIEEADGTKTLIRFTEPMSVLFGLSEYSMVLTA